MNTNSSLNSNQSSPASSNQNPPNNAPRISLREALLQQITPAEVAEAEVRALATLAAHPEEDSPDPPDGSPQAAHKPSRHAPPTEAIAANSPEFYPESERHSRKCTICNHPDRHAIDQSYLHWVSPHDIIVEYRLPSRVALYRHASATGLYNRRRGGMVHALEHLVEQATNTQPTADAIIRAVRACSLLNEDGRWVEPPRRVEVNHRTTVTTLESSPAHLVKASAPKLESSSPTFARALVAPATPQSEASGPDNK